MIYHNFKNQSVDIEKLSNEDLVKTYRWFLKYYNTVSKMTTEDDEYKIYIKEICTIKDEMKIEIGKRKLKMNKY